MLFSDVDVLSTKLVAEFTVESGEFNINLRPRNLQPIGPYIETTFQTGQRYLVEVWLDDDAAKCTVNGVDTPFVQEPAGFGVYAFQFSPRCTVTFHDLRFAAIE